MLSFVWGAWWCFCVVFLSAESSTRLGAKAFTTVVFPDCNEAVANGADSIMRSSCVYFQKGHGACLLGVYFVSGFSANSRFLVGWEIAFFVVKVLIFC